MGLFGRKKKIFDYEIGYKLLDENKFQESLEYFQQLPPEEWTEENMMSILGTANALMGLKQFAKARYAYEFVWSFKGIQKSEELKVKILGAISNTYLDEKNFKKTLEYANHMLVYEPNNAAATMLKEQSLHMLKIEKLCDDLES